MHLARHYVTTRGSDDTARCTERGLSTAGRSAVRALHGASMVQWGSALQVSRLPDAGPVAYAAGSLTSIRPSLSRVSNTGCRAVAGPRSIEPSRRLKREPWQGQVTDSPST